MRKALEIMRDAPTTATMSLTEDGVGMSAAFAMVDRPALKEWIKYQRRIRQPTPADPDRQFVSRPHFQEVNHGAPVTVRPTTPFEADTSHQPSDPSLPTMPTDGDSVVDMVDVTTISEDAECCNYVTIIQIGYVMIAFAVLLWVLISS